MSISDRLGQIEDRADAATGGPWEPDGQDFWTPAGRSDFHLSISDAEFIAHARTDVPDLLAALRAVLDVCEGLEEAHRANPTQMYEYGMEESAHQVRNAIATALGEGQ